MVLTMVARIFSFYRFSIIESLFIEQFFISFFIDHLDELEFIETRVITSKEKTFHDMKDGVNVLNLVDGTSAVIESITNEFPPFTLHYVETIIIPAAVKAYSIRPEKENEEIKFIKAYVRQ